jgi:hypothetical protein
VFETDKEVLDWYERQPRALSREYVENIRWNEIKNHPVNPAFVPVLMYMRDIEYFTDMYYQELRRTPAKIQSSGSSWIVGALKNYITLIC